MVWTVYGRGSLGYMGWVAQRGERLVILVQVLRRAVLPLVVNSKVVGSNPIGPKPDASFLRSLGMCSDIIPSDDGGTGSLRMTSRFFPLFD